MCKIVIKRIFTGLSNCTGVASTSDYQVSYWMRCSLITCLKQGSPILSDTNHKQIILQCRSYQNHLIEIQCQLPHAINDPTSKPSSVSRRHHVLLGSCLGFTSILHALNPPVGSAKSAQYPSNLPAKGYVDPALPENVQLYWKSSLAELAAIFGGKICCIVFRTA